MLIDMGWMISWPIPHEFSLSTIYFSGYYPFEYLNMKANEYAIEYFKNLHSQDALATVSCDQCKDFGFPYQIPNQNGVEFVF